MKVKHLFIIAIAITLTLAIGIALTRFWDLTRTPPHTQPQQKSSEKKVRVNTQRRKPAGERRGTPKAEKGAEHFQDTEFYRTLIDNNLFRPLGWTPPRPREPYRLLGTIVPKDAHAVPQAILQATAANITHIVTIGQKLDKDTKITDIRPRQVTLEKAGQLITLTLNTDMWLK